MKNGIFCLVIVIVLVSFVQADDTEKARMSYFAERGITQSMLSGAEVLYGVKKSDYSKIQLEILLIELYLMKQVKVSSAYHLQYLRVLECGSWLAKLKKRGVKIYFPTLKRLFSLRRLKLDIKKSVEMLVALKQVLSHEEWQKVYNANIPPFKATQWKALAKAGMKGVDAFYLRSLYQANGEAENRRAAGKKWYLWTFPIYLAKLNKKGFAWWEMAPEYLLNLYIDQLCYQLGSMSSIDTLPVLEKIAKQKISVAGLSRVIDSVYEKNKAGAFGDYSLRFKVSRFLEDPALKQIVQAYKVLPGIYKTKEVPLYVGRYMFANKTWVSRATSRAIVSQIYFQRGMVAALRPFKKGQDVLVIANNETLSDGSFRFGSDKLINAIQKQTGKAPMVYRPEKTTSNAKLKKLQKKLSWAIINAKPGTVFVFDGHGSKTAFWLENGLNPYSGAKPDNPSCIHSSSFATLLLMRYIKWKTSDRCNRDIFIFSQCLSQNFYRESWQKLSTYKPVIVAESEYGQVAYTNYSAKSRSSIIDHILKCGTLGKVFKATDGGKMSNLSVFVGTLQVK